jgi:processive 1,2-diacylglycerol beta-glucosyltransferase
MKKILILTAGFGEGHNAAARNIKLALEETEQAQVVVLDLFESTYTTLNSIVKRAHLGVVRYAPSLWGGIYSLLDRSTFLENRLGGFTRLRDALGHILHELQPDCVISTYPAYGHVIRQIYRDHVARPFCFITVVTDSITVNSAWFKAESDFFVVANEATAEVMRRAGVADQKIKPLGFPVSRDFSDSADERIGPPDENGPLKLLYPINTGKKKTGKALERLLADERIHLTITAGTNEALKTSLEQRFAPYGDRVTVLGWSDQMPRLMMTHHLAIGKAGGATVQESIAAQCPMIINQILPGQEEGNARLIQESGIGTIVLRNRDMPAAVAAAFAKRNSLWSEWRFNLAKVSRPNSARAIADLVLKHCDWQDPSTPPGRGDAPASRNSSHSTPTPPLATPAAPRALLCDFHIHSDWSDGKLSVPELVDFYGKRGFDAICVTDHLADPRRVCGKISNLTNLVLDVGRLDEYFALMERERKRAMEAYGMIVMTGIEFNKDGLTKKSSAHLLGIDLKFPISPALDLPETIAQIHSQDGLAVASHPHCFKTEWGKNTLYLWENIDTFAPLIDAWEIANRNEIFTPVGLRRLPYLANSDFHKPKHIYSWKTLLHCAKEASAIKECIRHNRHVSMILYREGAFRQSFAQAAEEPQFDELENLWIAAA